MITKKESAVSDAIGVILLISVATIAIGIVAVQLISEISVNQVPNADIVITSENTEYFFHMERGDSLNRNQTSFVFRNDDTGEIIPNSSPLIKFYYETKFNGTWADKKCGNTICPLNASSTIRARPDVLISGNITVMILYNSSPGNPMILKSASFPWWV